MTSNVGSDVILDLSHGGNLGFKEDRSEKLDESAMRERVNEMLHERFKPEFLNRVDEIVTFHPLSERQLIKIVDLQLGKVAERLAARHIKISVSDKAKKFLAKQGFDPVFGARPLKRVIQNLILNPLSLQIIEGKIKEDKTVKIDVAEDKIVFR